MRSNNRECDDDIARAGEYGYSKQAIVNPCCIVCMAPMHYLALHKSNEPTYIGFK
jgi:hypothetical protein